MNDVLIIFKFKNILWHAYYISDIDASKSEY